MDEYQPTSRGRLLYGFLVGMLWMAVIAAIASAISGYSFLGTYLAVTCGGLFTGGVCLAWLTRWALNKEARQGQFGVASLLFLITLIAIYLAAVRFVFVSLSSHLVGRAPIAGIHFSLYWLVLPAALICLLAAMISVPIVVRLLESLLWFAVWLVRHPQTRRWVKKLRR